MKWIVAVLLLALTPREAEACTCSNAGVEVVPWGDRAPTNSRIRVFVPSADVKGLTTVVRAKKGTTKTITEGKGRRRKTRTVVLPAPAIPTDRVTVGAGKLGVIELAPRQELKPRTAYVVALQVDGGKEEIVGEFETGDGPDTTAPAWSGVTKAEYERARPKVCCDCSTGDTHATLTVSKPDEPVVYGVWLEGDDGKIHYEDAPLTYVLSRGSQLKLGSWSQCLPSNFVFPETDTDTLVIGVRAFDFAGNVADTAGEAVLDVRDSLPIDL
jgi:hypothetical protein